MKVYRHHSSSNFGFPEDVAILVSVAMKNGYMVSPRDAESIWEDYSDSMCAGWMVVREGDDEYIWHSMKQFMDIEDE